MEPDKVVPGRFKVIEMWENDVKRVIHIPLDAAAQSTSFDSSPSIPFPACITTTSSTTNNPTTSTTPTSLDQDNVKPDISANDLDKNRPPPFIDFRESTRILQPPQATPQVANVSHVPVQRPPVMPAITVVPQSINILPQRTQIPPQTACHQRPNFPNLNVDKPRQNRLIMHGPARFPLINSSNVQNAPSVIVQPQRPIRGAPICVPPNFQGQKKFESVLVRPRYPIPQQQNPVAPLSIQINNTNYYDLKLLKPPLVAQSSNCTVIIEDEQATQKQTDLKDIYPSLDANVGIDKEHSDEMSIRFTNHKTFTNERRNVSLLEPTDKTPSPEKTSSNDSLNNQLDPSPVNTDTNNYSIIPSFSGRLKVIIRKPRQVTTSADKISNPEMTLNPSGPPVPILSMDQLTRSNEYSKAAKRRKNSELKKLQTLSESIEAKKLRKTIDGASSRDRNKGMKDKTSPEKRINVPRDVAEVEESGSELGFDDGQMNNVANVEINNIGGKTINNPETMQVAATLTVRIERLEDNVKKEIIYDDVTVNITDVEMNRESSANNEIDNVQFNNASEHVIHTEHGKTLAIGKSKNVAGESMKSQLPDMKVSKHAGEGDESINKSPNNKKRQPHPAEPFKNSRLADSSNNLSESFSSTKHNQSEKTPPLPMNNSSPLKLENLPHDDNLLLDWKLHTECKIDLRMLKLRSKSMNLRNVKAKDLYCCLRKLKGGICRKSKTRKFDNQPTGIGKNVKAKKRKIN